MLFNIKHMRTWWPLATLITTLTLAGCSDDDRKGIITADSLNKVGNGEMFHGAEWATIKNLDPRGEQCIDCHGKSADMSPNNGKGHNIGLKNIDTPQSLGVEGIKITKVIVEEATGKVTVTLNQAIPAGANFGLTFAKLAPRVVHNRGHDWQNYFASSDLAFGERRKKDNGIDILLANGGAQPLLAQNPVVNGKTITFNLGDGANRSWGKHAFTVKSAYATDTDTYEYENITGTKVTTTDLANNIYCDDAAAGNGTSQPAANQTPVKSSTSGKNPVCWWPDGTHLPAGVFVTSANELVVQYQPDYTHRLALIINGSPGHNVWYDFVPSVANGDKAPNDLKHADIAFVEVSDYVKEDGRVVAADYELAYGRGIPGSLSDNNSVEVAKHQTLPAARDVVDVQSCNSCHDSLSMHGGSRSQTQTCVTCHNPGNLQASSGRSMDFKVLIHRIHRGNNLPSEQTAATKDKDGKDVKSIASQKNGKSLVADSATDFTKVRFPQGPRPGSAEGITNCVKCHMGSNTLAGVQTLADEIGAGPNYDVQSKLKLAKVTPQGDNWLVVRNVNACQACHDSNVWLSDGGSINAVNTDRTPDSIAARTVDSDALVATHKLDKYMPFYDAKYTGTGYKWLGKKLNGVATSGGGGAPQHASWIHNTELPSNSARFTCGSSGGCHTTPTLKNIALADTLTWGSRTGSHAVERMHLALPRTFIIAERFEIKVKDVNVDAVGFHVKAELIDKKDGSVITDPKAHFNADLGSLIFTANAMFGWMANGSPDYNQSAGGGFGSSLTGANITSGGQPGAPAGLKALAFNSIGEGSLTITWDEINTASGNSYDFNTDFDKATSFGTVAINASLQATIVGTAPIRLRSANQDFSFADGMLAEGQLARRQVVDFSAGSGIDENRDRYASWDKEHGSNTQSCSSCHLKFDMHGATVSNNTQMCVMCHNPNLTDVRSRTKDANGMVALGADGQYEESEDFKRLIHAAHAAANFRIDPLQTRLNQRPSPLGATTQGHSFPGVLSNCKACHVETEPGSGIWTFDLNQLPKGQIGSTMITGDWATVPFAAKGTQHNLDNHLKMTPIASVCSSCHDAGYKGGDDKVRTNANILDGGPYVGSHWWVMGGIAPGIVRPNELPSTTKHQSGL